MQAYSQSPFAYIRFVPVCKSPHVFYSQEREDIFKTYRTFHIWRSAYGGGLDARKFEHVLRLGGIIAFGEIAPEASETEHLANACPFYEWYLVEQKSLHVVLQIPAHEFVHGEFHRVHHRERPRIGQI